MRKKNAYQNWLAVGGAAVAVVLIGINVQSSLAYPRYTDGCNASNCHGDFDGPTSPKGTVFPGNTAVTGNQQAANNALNPGWNYKGSLIIPPKTNFLIELAWASPAPAITTDTNIRISLHGILSRRTL